MGRKECDVELWDPYITSNKAMLRCQGGVVLHFVGESTEVKISLSDEGLRRSMGRKRVSEWIPVS